MRKLIKLLLIVTLLCAQPLLASELDAHFARFLDWFPGEYNNHEQVWQAGVSKEDPHEHLHHIFAPVAVPALGAHVVYVQQHMNADPEKIYRQRLYLLEPNRERDAIMLTIYSFADDAAVRNAHRDPSSLAGLTAEQLRNIPGCEVYWTWNGEYYDGHMDEGACTFVSQRSGKRITITDDLRLTQNEIWIRDVARDEEGNLVFGDPDRAHHKNRKVQYYQGWIAIKRNGRNAGREDRDWSGMRDLLVHNEGQSISVVDDAGEAMGVRIELAQLTYQTTKVPILSLRVVDAESGELLGYAWGEPGAARLGINMGWIQAGFTRKPSRGAFGFD